MFKKVLYGILTVLVLLQTSTTYIFAQDNEPATWYNQGLQDWYLKVYDTNVSPPDEIFGERYTAAQVDWIIWSVLSWPLTKIVKPDATACLIGAMSGNVQLNKCWDMFFADAGTSQYYAMNYEPPKGTLWQAVFADRPFSGISYVKGVANRFHLVREAKAQGFGYTTALQPFRLMWQASRDVSYSLFVFAAIILAFMVMFRVKLSPQTAVTVQSAVPKLIFALILVTFSYAIAGFMVDLMYVVMGLLSIVGARFAPGSNMTDPVFVYNFMTLGPVISPSIPVVGNTALGLFGLFFLYIGLFAMTLIIVGLSLISTLAGQIAAILSFIGLAALLLTGLWTIMLLVFVVAFALIIGTVFLMFFKTWWVILKTFANIVLLTIFAPFQLLLGTFIPSMGFGTWIKGYISNLATFVGISFLFFLANIFLIQATATAFATTGRNDPILNKLGQVLFGTALDTVNMPLGATPGWPPLVTASSAPEYLAVLYLIFSLVIFFQIPKVADIIKSFMSGRPWAYGTAVGEGLGVFTGAFNSGPMGALRKEASEGTGAWMAQGGASLADKGARLARSARGGQIANSVGSALSRLGWRARRE